MKSLHRNKKGVSAAGLTELDYSEKKGVLNEKGNYYFIM